jgi:hypothetical protein
MYSEQINTYKTTTAAAANINNNNNIHSSSIHDVVEMNYLKDQWMRKFNEKNTALVIYIYIYIICFY